jgi:hypothetical protein
MNYFPHLNAEVIRPDNNRQDTPPEGKPKVPNAKNPADQPQTSEKIPIRYYDMIHA